MVNNECDEMRLESNNSQSVSHSILPIRMLNKYKILYIDIKACEIKIILGKKIIM